MKRCPAPFSIVHQIILLLLILGLLGIASMSISAWRAEAIQGHTYAINKAGSLRMQSYRLLTMVPLNSESHHYLDTLEQDQNSQQLKQTVDKEQLSPQLDALKQYWHQQLRPQLERARSPDQATAQVIQFVHHLDELVFAIDRKTEQSLIAIRHQQITFIALTLLVMAIALYYLRSHFLQPWRRLLAMSESIGQGDFTQRFEPVRSDEMGVLGATLNTMSDELSLMYNNLEARVKEKTAELQNKNQTLSFLYHASQQLHTNEPLCSRLLSVINQFQSIMPLYNLQIRLYENNDISHFQQISNNETSRPEHCQHDNCYACLTEQSQFSGPRQTLSWRLADQHSQYGLILAEHPIDVALTDEDQQLLNMLIDQLTSTLTLERQSHQQQQLLLMEERSAIARELHDSIAQSLSFLKIQVSCMQMENTSLEENSKRRLTEMRNELNGAYHLLRELLTTFRLQLSEAGLHAALQATVQEFSEKLTFPITLNYYLPLHQVSSHQAIHLVQIAREALNNIYKHANATQVTINIERHQGNIMMRISDNGRGLPEDHAKKNHYGLIIMRDRTRSLNGHFEIYNRPQGGAEVKVEFSPQPTEIKVSGAKND